MKIAPALVAVQLAIKVPVAAIWAPPLKNTAPPSSELLFTMEVPQAKVRSQKRPKMAPPRTGALEEKIKHEVTTILDPIIAAIAPPSASDVELTILLSASVTFPPVVNSAPPAP
eukprot:6544540-Prymnesium_polylepis.1